MAGSELSAYPPDGFELGVIERFVSLRRKRVLEIGCGDGRLTFQYATRASSVLAIEPDPASFEEAVSEQRVFGLRNVRFRNESIEQLPERGAKFDVALFSWSL